jgi:hypothetical protein
VSSKEELIMSANNRFQSSLFVCLAVLLVSGVSAEDVAPKEQSYTVQVPPNSWIPHPLPPIAISKTRVWTAIEIVLSVAVLLFGLAVVGLQTMMVLRNGAYWTPTEILRINGMTLIITASILLVTAGYSEKQAGPVMGLLGVLAGYLLGANGPPKDASMPAETKSPTVES